MLNFLGSLFGVSVSSDHQTLKNTTIDKAINSCPPISTMNIANLNNVDISAPPNCPTSSFDINQVQTVNATCIITSLQKQAADLATELNKSQQTAAGSLIGINISNDSSDVENTISNLVANQCAKISTTNSATINDSVIKACNIRIVQGATDNTMCQINNTQDVISKLSSKTSIQLGTGSIVGMIIVGIVIVIIIIVVIWVFIKWRKQKSGQMGGSESFLDYLRNNKSCMAIVGIIILFLIVAIVNFSRVNDKKLTMDDIQKLNKTINEAQQIANVRTEQYNSEQYSPEQHNQEQPEQYNPKQYHTKQYSRKQRGPVGMKRKIIYYQNCNDDGPMEVNEECSDGMDLGEINLDDYYKPLL